MTSITNSFNIININHFLIYNCEDTYLLNNLSSIVKEKIRRIYTFSGSNNSNILRWTPNDAFSQFSSLQPNKLYWVESLASNFTPYVLLEECVAIPPDPTITPTSTPTSTPTPTLTPTTTPPSTVPPGSNSANYNSQAVWLNSANVTTVGSNGGPSSYGTYDQTGNASEWNDLSGSSSAFRGIRGGSWDSFINGISSATRNALSAPSFEPISVGFRLSSPSSTPNPLNLPNFVAVGDAGNAADSNGYGSVNTDYFICKYSVTNCEYVLFLNSVDPEGTNPQGIYNTMMSDFGGGILFISGYANGEKYEARDNMRNKPVVRVGWFDAARYCNWLHNGALSYNTTDNTANAPQNTGAYNVGVATTGNAVAKQSNAAYHIPTENQWCKAAYYKGGSTNAGYWLHATQSDIPPTQVTASSAAGSIGDGLINGQPANDSDYVCT